MCTIQVSIYIKICFSNDAQIFLSLVSPPFDGVFFTLSFDEGGGRISIHLFLLKNNRKSVLFLFFHRGVHGLVVH